SSLPLSLTSRTRSERVDCGRISSPTSPPMLATSTRDRIPELLSPSPPAVAPQRPIARARSARSVCTFEIMDDVWQVVSSRNCYHETIPDVGCVTQLCKQFARRNPQSLQFPGLCSVF